MAKMNIILPAMGEGIIEATINKWLVNKGESVNEEDPLVEIATDKVDTEVPAPASGKISELLAEVGSIVKVGEPIAVLETEVKVTAEEKKLVEKEVARVQETTNELKKQKQDELKATQELKSRTPSGKFLSPLVRSIATQNDIAYSELDGITGTGMDGRITRDDILKYLEDRRKEEPAKEEEVVQEQPEAVKEVTGEKSESRPAAGLKAKPEIKAGTGDEIIEMDRVRKLIAEHMVMSKRTSAHVTSFIDADVTRMVSWRNSVKDKFLASEGQKLTLTPIFIDAAARALHEYPMLNSSVEGNNIILRKNINIGMATALPDGNLIVPVIKNANEKSLTGLARTVNDLADRARNNKLKPDEITGGTFTLTNFGSYNNLSGTPIIYQPQVAILGTGAVRKVPAVIETREGDVIAIRNVMILSISYDHRVIDGALAGKFLNKLKSILENYSPDIF
jgi:2-oxoglutarate dehydrogenase E2 component (dihydrolipoamide succinyltransferase)